MAKRLKLDRVFESKSDRHDMLTRQEVGWSKQLKNRVPELYSQHHLYTSAEGELRSAAIEPSGKELHGFELARQQVLSLQRKLGLFPTDKAKMEVLVLPPNVYDVIDPGDTAALTLYPMGAVLIKQGSYSFYHEAAGLAFHELIHRWLEPNSLAYSKNKTQSKTVTISLRRTGLIAFLPQQEDKDYATRGYLLNEMGTHYLEKHFLQELRALPLFSDEDKRLRKLFRLHGLARDGFYDMNTGSSELTIHKSNLIFTEGQLDIWYINQLIDNLQFLTGDITGESLGMALVRCKIDPRYQNIVRKRVDAEMGAGFYSRLRASFGDEDELIEFLFETQTVIESRKKPRKSRTR